jgi:hypothetical protein
MAFNGSPRFGLDDLRPLVERDLQRFRLMGLTDHQECVPGIAGWEAVELIDEDSNSNVAIEWVIYSTAPH